jgi:hypothetical protein
MGVLNTDRVTLALGGSVIERSRNIIPESAIIYLNLESGRS